MGNIQVSARIPANLYEKLVIEAQTLKVSKSELLLTALAQYFNNTQDIPLNLKLAQLEKRVAALEAQSREARSLASPRETTGAASIIALPPLQTYQFELVSVDIKGEICQRTPATAQYFSENLGNGISLAMLSIRGGTFLMGSRETEKGSREWEKPQHQVALNDYFMSQFPIAQVQWRAVANLPKVRRSLNPDPSYFKGDDRPVERVSWYDAIEFCDRLSSLTGRSYRLPSEAEWEYACRGGTTTPFYFGETSAGGLVNYMSRRIYRQESPQLDRQETTPVGSFPPNAFGLYDMHGNVWEWCSDRWHDNYEGAPVDGSAWLSESEDAYRLLRGGSWDFYPECCRSASRFSCPPTAASINQIGVRVVCI
ncbi:serine/threonine protein kinase [Hydrococcus rivularis NIES-593]|uniref:Serine/threonine protein kinase n=1 Tax=Hydrococcus rivularis NIES-593 TaxID=1921803 RepID=A0A1U7HRJ7_9CYAN|nr:formylglycine-generating enzyme family protein [Hydrococcus rivularis]OKH26216.1 serine/threonine protein kinase [Hydrococcus rivularis NIES-593]